MRTLKLITLILITFIYSEELHSEDNVLELTDDTFLSAVKKYDTLMVLFYAPWCEHCRNFLPEYSKAAEVLKKENIILAKVDATINKKLSEKYNIKGFPTTILLIEDSIIEYNGRRNSDYLIKWMRKRTGPASKELKSISEIKKFIKKNEISIIYFGTNEKEIKEYDKVARNDEENEYGIVKDSSLIKEFEVKESSVIIYKEYEDQVELTQDLTANNIKDFIIKRTPPKIMKFNEKASQLIFGQNKPALFLYVDPNYKHYHSLKKLFQNIAEQVKDKLQVIITGVKEGLETKLAEYIGVSENELPCVKIADTRNMIKKYNMEGEINEKNVLKFVKDWENDDLEVVYKSEEEPKSNKGNVYKLVGKTFKRDVINTKKDVLVKFYAPWCSHCKSFAKTYNELAKKLKNNENIVIAEIDATANEVEGEIINSFPTLKLYPGGEKSQPILYEGERNLNDMMDFIKKYSNNDIEIDEKENIKKEKVKEKKNEKEEKEKIKNKKDNDEKDEKDEKEKIKDKKDNDDKNDKYEDL